ncbi:hypothetical protein GOV07_00725, partial [Candidatus Woesearchaeota archaeon]|nr:hypothetical protein [Candidatus Woesearchaeota archaeon]
MKRLQPWLVPLAAILLLIPVVARYLKGYPLIPAGEFADPVVLISIALGVLTTFLFTKLAKRLTKSPRLQTLLTLLFIINPVFLALFTSVNPLVLAVPIALFLLLTSHRLLLILGSLLLSFINPIFAILFFATTWKRIFLPGTLLAAALAIIRGNLIHQPVVRLVE